MKVVALVGDAVTDQFTESLLDRLGDRGTVGLVQRDEADSRDGDHHREVRLSEDGRWSLTGQDTSLDEVLDRLAPECEYVVVTGYDVDVPKVVIGDRTDDEDVLLHGSTPAEIDIEDVVETLATVEPYETLESLVARVKESTDETFAGAIATFTGRVRAKEHEDDEYTEYLEFERYDGVAQEKTRRIREELESRDGIYEVVLHHKTGVVEAGEDIVFVVVLAGHRSEAFRTVEDGINRLKEEVPLFKKEVTVDGEFWAHTGKMD